MKPIWKLVAVSALAVCFAFGFGGSAMADSYMEFRAASAAGHCSCCPSSCGGGTYFGCWNSVDHPSNAVTCIYQGSQGHFNCLSCMVSATPAQAELFPAESSPVQAQP